MIPFTADQTTSSARRCGRTERSLVQELRGCPTRDRRNSRRSQGQLELAVDEVLVSAVALD